MPDATPRQARVCQNLLEVLEKWREGRRNTALSPLEKDLLHAYELFLNELSKAQPDINPKA